MSASNEHHESDTVSCLVRALALYAFAEAQSGYATTIQVETKGRTFSVADNGRGHAIERAIDGTPYLKFVYEHLDYPFEAAPAAIQLHTIGISLINALCLDLIVIVRKRDSTLRLTYRRGHLLTQELDEAKSEETGNIITGAVHPHLHRDGADPEPVRLWLRRVGSMIPCVKVYFNGQVIDRL